MLVQGMDKECIISEVFTAEKMWELIFWVVTPFRFVGRYQCFG
jgi:hypothetical protein